MTEPGKGFLFICRSLDQGKWLVRWLELLEINPPKNILPHQTLSGVLKAMWLSSRLREAV